MMTNLNTLSSVFICGHPKAGTSLVMSLLDGHPNIVAYPEETLFFRRFLPAIEGKNEEEILALADELLIHVFQWSQKAPPEHQKDYPDRDYSDIDFEQIRQAYRAYAQTGDSSDRRYLEAAIMAFGSVTGLLSQESRCWVEKTPNNEFYSDKIFNLWPEAKCVHIIRDPRDNYVSYMRKHPEWSAKVFAWSWMRSTRAGMENQGCLGRDRYHLIYFEELLRNPEATTRQLADFLEIDWDESLLQPTRVGDSWRGNSMFDEKYKTISTDPIDRWKEKISPLELAVLQAIAGKTMHALGYEIAEIEMGKFSLGEKIQIWRERFVADLKDI